MTPLVVRLPNWVGDVCMALPTLAALHQAGFACHLAGRRWLGDLLAGYQLPCTVVGRGIRAPARSLAATGIAQGLLMTNSFGTAAAMRLAGIRAIGFRGDGRRWLLHRSLARMPGAHEVERFWSLGRAAASRWLPDADWPSAIPGGLDLPVTGQHRDAAATALADAGIAPPYTLLCPLATGTIAGRSKVWPHWTAFGEALASEGQHLVCCPGPGEEDAARAALPMATLLPGLGLGAYAAVAAGASRVIANDSGPMHLAAAVGAPVLGIFGVGDPARTRPWGGDWIGAADQWPEVAQVLERLRDRP